MSASIIRRNSSKQGLQDLLRLVAQRSIEDAEEIEREHRRRRAREPVTDNNQEDSGSKPCLLAQEDDEGFGDWGRQRHEEQDAVTHREVPQDEEYVTETKISCTSHTEAVNMSNTPVSTESSNAVFVGPLLEQNTSVTWEVQKEFTERTEALNISLSKSTQHAALASRDGNVFKTNLQGVEQSFSNDAQTDSHSLPQPVASKNLFQSEGVRNQESTRTSPPKEAEGLKVGVAELITQWARGGADDSSKNAPLQLSDVKAGDVLHKKNLWETLGDSSCSQRKGQTAKSTSLVKRYKFVVTGHGKYEKVGVEEDEKGQLGELTQEGP